MAYSPCPTLPHSLPGIVVRWSPTFPRMFRPYTMTSSNRKVTTRFQVSSSAHLVDDIPSIMPSLLPQLAVSLLLSWLIIPSLLLSSTSILIVQGILYTQPRLEKVRLSIPSLYILQSVLYMSLTSSRGLRHSFPLMAQSVL